MRGRLLGVAEAGERYESKTRTFSQLSLLSSTNFMCRGCSWYLSWAALLTKTRCSDTSKSWSLKSPVQVAGECAGGEGDRPLMAGEIEFAGGDQLGPVRPRVSLSLK